MAKKKLALKKAFPFSPDFAVAPGVTLAETLAAKGMAQSELSMRTGLAEKTISQIMNGVAPISFDTALKLEAALGVPARFWNNLERNYQEAQAQIAQAERLEADLDWLKTIPVRELIRGKFIEGSTDKVSALREVLHFYGVSDVSAWKRLWVQPTVAFRRTRAKDLKVSAASAWIRMGELIASQISCQAYDATKFRTMLGQARELTIASPGTWHDEMVRLCAEAGVAITFVPAIPGAGISGVTKWLSPEKALIQLSLLYKNDGSFWFTFFHEAAHVLLHGKKDVFLEGDSPDDDEKEREADEFARNMLIPRIRVSELKRLRTERAIRDFAREIGVSTGIVVGRLQHDRILYPSAFNNLKRKLDWSKP